MKYNSRIETRIDKQTKERLRARAIERGLRLSQLVRMILTEWDRSYNAGEKAVRGVKDGIK